MSVELHIVVQDAGSPDELTKLVNEAIAIHESAHPPKQYVPPGYRCQECFDDGGDHQLTCSFKGG